jgi:DNA-binding GntR family transcriptional regulator
MDVTPAALEGLTISRTSTAERVAEALRGMILDGAIPPETRLREEALARSLSVSRNTVREAIQILVHQGLVTRMQNRGAVVVQLNAEDVADIYRARVLLEVMAIRGSGAATPQQLARVGEAIDRLAAAAATNDADQLVDHDFEFHRAIAGLLASKRLEGLYDLIQGELRFCLAILSQIDREFEDPEPLVAEHRAVYEALVAGRPDEAAELMRVHLVENEQRLQEILRTTRKTAIDGG